MASSFTHSYRSRTAFLVTTVIVCLLGDIFAYGVMIPVLPSILARVGAHEEDLQSLTADVIAIHAGFSMICFPGAGLLSDRSKTRRMPLIWGTTVFAIATALFFYSTTITAILLAKAIQGGISALLWTSGLALCFDTVEPDRLGTTIGIVLSVHDVGALLSPPLGGILYSIGGRDSLASICLPILVTALAMTLVMIEKPRKALAAGIKEHLSDREAQDNPLSHAEDGTVLEIPCGGKETDQYTLKHTKSSHLARKAPILLCLQNSSLLVAIAICTVQAALLGAFDATISLEANRLWGFSPSKSGLFFISIGVTRFATGPLGGKAVDCFGPRVVGVTCYAAMVPILLSFNILASEPRVAQIALYASLLAAVGTCIGGVNTVSFVEAGNIIRRYHDANPSLFGHNGPFASLYGLNLMVYSLGMTLGSLMAGLSQSAEGYDDMIAVLAAMAFVAAVASQLGLERKTYRQGERCGQSVAP